MKSLPGEVGIGVGHRLVDGDVDHDFRRLRGLVGDAAADHYIRLMAEG